MMKRMIALLLIAVLSLPGLALAEGGGSAADPKIIDRFTDVWVDKRVAAEIWYDEDAGSFQCHVVLGDGGDESTVVEYADCRYESESDALICEGGVRTVEAYDEAAKEQKKDVQAEGVTATFRFNDEGRLLWDDSEGLGKDFALQRLADAEEAEWQQAQAFVGRWGCERATIDITEGSGGGYDVRITWGSSAWESVEWHYACSYDGNEEQMYNYEPGTKAVVTYGEGGDVVSTVTEYEDGAATFTIDADGMLIWNDAKENAAEGMRFERGIL